MRKIRYLLIFLAVFSLSANVLFALSWKSPKKPNGNNGPQNISAGCVSGSAQAFVDLNNVRAFVNSKGGMWEDGAIASYEVPKGSGQMSLYAGGIWVAGVDVNGQLRVAARLFTSGGDDYWPGPLVGTGNNKSQVTDDICLRYDRLWKVDKVMVSEFISWYNGTHPNEAEYQIPRVLQDWPGNGPDFAEGVDAEYDRYLAPYNDANGDGMYNISGGDYPNYEFEASTRCRFVPERRADSLTNSSVTLYGDQTTWWVYNDKGNIHTGTSGAAIGMEVRGQAFAFSTNDELNNMTFYNYQLINRSTYRLSNAYFGVWVDADLGVPSNDVVGCDVSKGLSFAYNFTNEDGTGTGNSYGSNPPAVGIDFFEGPYQDANSDDDISSWNAAGALDCEFGYRDNLDSEGNVISRDRVGAGNIFNGNINGLNFGDGIADNERWGMRRFVYHLIGTAGPNSDPETAMDCYNYLQGYWKDNARMTHGGSGVGGTMQADFMFPWNTDVCNWGTYGEVPSNLDWRAEQPGDARILQSSGPFVLEPGATNYITIGVPWARSFTRSEAVAAVDEMKNADDKAQKLFENCFRMVEAPHAPDLAAVQLDNRLILQISNSPVSNNYLEGYIEKDPFIAGDIPEEDKFYKFQGYQIFQLLNKDVTVNQLYDESYSKIVYQCDIEDDIARLINYTWVSAVEANQYQVMVEAANEGVNHSFVLTEDAFADASDNRLVNYKKYYYIAIAYAHNNFKDYSQSNPNLLNGQTKPYLASRRGVDGEIKKYEFIPQPTQLSQNGIELTSDYADVPAMTYHSGRGNSTNFIDLDDETVNQIMDPTGDWKALERKYKRNAGPFDIRVIDPLNVVDGDFIFYIDPDSVNTDGEVRVDYMVADGIPTNTDVNGVILTTKWKLIRNQYDTVTSESWMRFKNEYLISEWGMAVNVHQVRTPIHYSGAQNNISDFNNGFIGALTETQNPLGMWLSGVNDQEGQTPFNWIRSGTFRNTVEGGSNEYNDISGDELQAYESVLLGTWSPYRFVGTLPYNPGNKMTSGTDIQYSGAHRLPSIDFVITKDKSRWTRSIVIETGENVIEGTTTVYPNPLTEGGALKFMLRQSPSLNKDGVPANSMTMEASTNQDDPNFISAYGMSWFPGYAIDVETGERLNIAFGEDSYLIEHNGRDMIWNPNNMLYRNDLVPIMGGKHYVYVFTTGRTWVQGMTNQRFPRYDHGQTLFDIFNRRTDAMGQPETLNALRTRIENAMKSVGWVNIPIAYQTWSTYAQMPEEDVTIKIRIANAYMRNVGMYEDTIHNAINKGYPYVTFNMDDMAAKKGVISSMPSVLDDINIVPNPYYAQSAYEVTNLDNVVKIINLPRDCQVKIFNMSGTLVRSYDKASDQTWIDWDLTNMSAVPIAGGVYIIHVNVPNVGEKVLKWFGVLRQVDLSAI